MSRRSQRANTPPTLRVSQDEAPAAVEPAVKYAHQLELMAELSQLIGAGEKVEIILQGALSRLRDNLGYSAAQIYRLSPSGRELWLYIQVFSASQPTLPAPEIFAVDETNSLSQVVRSGEAVVTAGDVALPLKSGTELVGVLHLQSLQLVEPDPATPSGSTGELTFLAGLASLLATAIRQTQTVQQLQDELQEIQILYNLQRDEAAGRRAATGRVTAPGYQYNCQAVSPLDDLPVTARLALVDEQLGISTFQEDDRQELIAPIKLGGETIGILGIEDSETGRAWSTDDMRLLEEVTSQVALAVENSRLLQQTQERTRELAILFDTSRQLSETINLEQIYQILTAQVINYLGADLCAVSLLDRDQVSFDVIVEKRRGGTGQLTTGRTRRRREVVADSPVLQGLLQQPGLRVEHRGEGATVGLRRATLSKPGRELVTLVTFPLFVRGRLIGLMDVGHTGQRREYLPGEFQLAQALIGQAMVAVENAQLFQQTESALAETRKLYQISRSLVESAHMDDIFAVVLENVRAFGIDRVSLSLLDRSRSGKIEAVIIAASWDREGDKLLPVGTRFAADTFSLVQAFAQPPFHPLISEDLSLETQDTRMDDGFRLFMYKGLGAVTLFSAPMFLGADYKGVISISTRQPHHYTEQEIRVYQTLADQAIIAIERQNLLEATRRERDRASLLYELGQELSRTTSIEEVEVCVLEFGQKVGAQSSEIYLTDGDDYLSMASTLLDQQEVASTELIRERLNHGPAAEALRQRRSVIEPTAEAGSTGATISVPFSSQRSSMQGVLTFFQPAGVTADFVSTLESAAVQVSAALENAWLLQQTTAALSETELLYRITRDFNSARHVEELLDILVETLSSNPIDFMAIALIPGLSPAGTPEALDFVATWERVKGIEVNPGLRLTARECSLIAGLSPSLAQRIETDKLEPEMQAGLAHHFGPLRSFLYVPLSVGKDWLGTLLIGASAEEDVFKLGLVNQVTALAGQAAVVMQNLQLVEETQQNLFNSEILSHLSQELLVADTSEAIYTICLEAIAATEPERGAAIFMYDQIAGSVDLEMVALWNNPSQDWVEVPIGSRFSTEDLGLVPLLRTGQTVISLDAPQDERFLTVLRTLLTIMQINNMVAVPVWLNKEVNGFILIGNLSSQFSAETIRLYEDIARQISGALENGRLFEEARYRATLLETAAEISQAATGTLDLATLLPQTVELIKERFNYYHVSIFLVDDYQRYAVVAASTGEIGRIMLARGHKLEVGGKSIVGTATATGKSRIALDVGKDAVHFNNPLLPDTRSEMALPLIARGRVIGALDVQSTQAGAFSQSDITILQSMANQLANAIEAALALQQSKQALEEANKARDRYVQEKWEGFLKQHEADFHYQLANGSVEPVFDEHSQAEINQALSTGRPLLFSQEPADGGPAEPATLVAPLKLHEGAIIGAVDFHLDNPREALAEDAWEIIEAVTGQAAQAIEAARLFEQTQVAREEAEALYRVGRALVEAESLQEMYTAVLGQMLATLGLKQGGVLFFEEDRKFGQLHALFVDGQPVPAGQRFPVAANESYQEMMATRRPVAIEDMATDPRVELVRQMDMVGNITSLLLVPIIVNDEVIGAMGADSVGQIHAFTQREINLASAMASQLSLMLQNRRLLEETRRRAIQLQTSSDVGRVATSLLDQDQVLEQAVELIKERFGFYHVQVFLVDGAGQYAVLHKSTGEVGRRLLALGHKLAIGSQSVIGQVTHLRRSMVVRTNEAPATTAQGRNELLPDTRAELAVPLQVGDSLLGVLDVQSTVPDAFTQEDISVLETLAAQLAIALQNARAFQEQQETAERLKEIDKLKTQFLANMSHELRTPLNSIIGFSRVILKGIDGPLTELQKTDLTSIHNSGQHLLGLINNILDVSKIEAGKMELSFEDVDVEPIIKGVMSTAIALVKDKPVKLVSHMSEGIPKVWADPTRLRQVILNLVSNACKFTDNGVITVEARADTERLIVSVTDTGIGIPQDQLGNIFEEFTQVDASTTRKVGGTGLGLPISRHFVEMHHGQIWVDSIVGQGSTFTFVIPLRPASETEAQRPVNELLLDQKGGNGQVILAIDDDPGVITLYQRFLEKQNYKVVGLTQSRDTVARVKELKPFAILLDVLIPERDGWSVIRDLKEDPFTKDIPVIICSIVSDKNRGFSLGAADYLVKPIVENDLVKAIQNLDDQQKNQVKVLVIDDQADDILLIRRILEAQTHYSIIEASSGQEGLELVRTKDPDLIILDLSMPEMDGFSVVEVLKSSDKARVIPIIIVSAKELSPAEHGYLTNHVEALLRKGIFTENELLEDVSQALQRIQKKEIVVP